MRRALVVVARDRHDLYEYFKAGFDGIDDIEVILDRRVLIARDSGARPVDPERRQEIDTHDELLLRGFIIRQRG
jgi:hypothetical protein